MSAQETGSLVSRPANQEMRPVVRPAQRAATWWTAPSDRATDSLNDHASLGSLLMSPQESSGP